jgi:hypothetical protein
MCPPLEKIVRDERGNERSHRDRLNRAFPGMSEDEPSAKHDDRRGQHPVVRVFDVGMHCLQSVTHDQVECQREG